MREKITEALYQNMSEVIEGIDISQIDASKSMKDFGADSLEMVEVVSRTMKQLKIKIPRTQLSNVETINDLIDLFETHQKDA